MTDAGTGPIEVVRELCLRVSGVDALAAAVATGLGDVTEDPGPPLPISVRPRAPAFSLARVARDDGGQVRHVELVLAEGASPPLADLRAAFGPLTEAPRLHWDAPTLLVGALDPGAAAPAAHPFTCAVIVAVTDAPGPEGGPGAPTTITVRRDPR